MSESLRSFRIDPDAVQPDDGRAHGSAYVVVDDRGGLLLQQRDDPTPPEGYGRWALPGGGVEPGETPREAAIREAEEETGLRLDAVRYYRTFFEPENPRVGEFMLHVFLACEPFPKQRIEVHEGLDFRFWSPEEARALRMNPAGSFILEAMLASDHYRSYLPAATAATAAACVIILDCWGRVLLQLRDADLPAEQHPSTWTVPGGALDPGESPDAGALREFEEETGHLLDSLHFYRAFSREEIPAAYVPLQHVYFIDADLDPADLEVNEGQALQYFAPAELPSLTITPWTEPILRAFVESPAYKRLFH